MVKLGPFQFITGSGHVVTETRDVRDFDTITVSGSGSIVIAQTGEESLTIEADDNILPLLTSEVHNHNLQLGARRGAHFSIRGPIRYRVTVRDLRGLMISGVAKAQLSALTTDELRVTISGAGDLQASALTASAVHVTISGSGDISLAGQAARQEVHITGSGAYRAADLASERASVNVSGAGKATINARDRIDAHISGVGSIRYTGQPAITRSISGSGSIRPLNA